MCQFCGVDEDMLTGVTVDQETKRCTLCEPEWSDITARFRDPRTITKHWRAGARARVASRQAAVNAEHAARTSPALAA